MPREGREKRNFDEGQVLKRIAHLKRLDFDNPKVVMRLKNAFKNDIFEPRDSQGNPTQINIVPGTFVAFLKMIQGRDEETLQKFITIADCIRNGEQIPDGLVDLALQYNLKHFAGAIFPETVNGLFQGADLREVDMHLTNIQGGISDSIGTVINPKAVKGSIYNNKADTIGGTADQPTKATWVRGNSARVMSNIVATKEQRQVTVKGEPVIKEFGGEVTLNDVYEEFSNITAPEISGNKVPHLKSLEADKLEGNAPISGKAFFEMREVDNNTRLDGETPIAPMEAIATNTKKKMDQVRDAISNNPKALKPHTLGGGETVKIIVIPPVAPTPPKEKKDGVEL